MSIPRSATLDGTIRYRERFKVRAAKNHFREQQNLWLSSIGTGTYLGNPDDETDARYTAAISHAVELGAVSIVDNSAPSMTAMPGPYVAADMFAYNAGWADKIGGDVIEHFTV